MKVVVRILDPSLIAPTESCLGLTQKSLQRLFPCDTSMVVIIDDRADVWEWSPNLIKVIPCKVSYPVGVQNT
jgi:RNA polymerase II subunit A-like phosphatase